MIGRSIPGIVNISFLDTVALDMGVVKFIVAFRSPEPTEELYEPPPVSKLLTYDCLIDKGTVGVEVVLSNSEEVIGSLTGYSELWWITFTEVAVRTEVTVTVFSLIPHGMLASLVIWRVGSDVIDRVDRFAYFRDVNVSYSVTNLVA